MRPVLALHKNGVDTTRIYSLRTRQRHCRFFSKRGIDIHCPNQPVESITSLLRYLSPKKVINEPPEWMKEMKLVPLSAKERIARGNAKLESRDQEPLQLNDDVPDIPETRLSHGRII
jgi:hypothetical protein